MSERRVRTTGRYLPLRDKLRAGPGLPRDF